MKIYKEYDTESLMFNEPCIMDKCTLYPILVSDYKEFSRYVQYLIISKKHLKIPDEVDLLQSIIIATIGSYTNGNLDLTNDISRFYMKKVLSDFEKLFSILTRKEMHSRVSKNGGFEFVDAIGDKEPSVVIDNKNYDDVRKVAISMACIKEPKVYDNPIMQEWYNRYKLSKQNNKLKFGLEDMVIVVSQDMKIMIDDIKKMNIAQLYAYYNRINHVENYRAVTIFRTVTNKLPNINYIDGVISGLYEDDDKDMFIDLGTIGTQL